MKKNLLRLSLFCIIALTAFGTISMAGSPGEVNQSPVVMIKVRSLERLLNDATALMPQNAALQGQQLSIAKALLFSGNWLDDKRSIVVGMIPNGTASSGFALIPFRSQNPLIQQTINAVARQDYYVAAIPPRQGFVIAPAVEDSLVKASMTPSATNLTLEISGAAYAAMLAPQMGTLFKTLETAQLAQNGKLGPAPQDIQGMIGGMLDLSKQVDLFRVGVDVSDKVLTLQYEVDALPGTALQGVFTEIDGTARLASYTTDMPLQFRSRAHSMSAALELAKPILGGFYSRLGIDLNAVIEVVKTFTGEMAGGLKISPAGMDMELVYVLQPGTNGENFLFGTYLPGIDYVRQQIAGAVAQASGGPQGLIFERTANSSVAGLTVAGFKTNLSALIPKDDKRNNPFINQVLETRMAAMGDLLLVASSDAKLASMIQKVTGMASAPAQGPTEQFNLNLGAFFQDLQPLAPNAKAPFSLPDNLGNLAVQVDMRDGKLLANTSINLAEILKLSATAKTQIAKK
jgi:hypothetical protein